MKIDDQSLVDYKLKSEGRLVVTEEPESYAKAYVEKHGRDKLMDFMFSPK